MAVQSVNKLYSGRGGTDTYTRQRTYREEYEVIVDDPLNSESDVAQAVGIPRVGTVHPRDAAALCIDIDADQSEDSPYIWMVSVKYDTKFDLPNALAPTESGGGGDSLQPGETPENPLQRPPVWRIGVGGSRKSVALPTWRRVDAAGNLAANATPIMSSNKLPFDPPVQVELSRVGVQVTVNVPFMTLGFVNQLKGAINDRAWRGLPKWTVKIENVDAGSKYENRVAFWELSIGLEIDPDTWLTEVLDAGRFELTDRRDSVTGVNKKTWTLIRDPFGGDGPFPLDGQGKKLLPDAPPVYFRGLTRNLHLENFTALLGF